MFPTRAPTLRVVRSGSRSEALAAIAADASALEAAKAEAAAKYVCEFQAEVADAVAVADAEEAKKREVEVDAAWAFDFQLVIDAADAALLADNKAAAKKHKKEFKAMVRAADKAIRDGEIAAADADLCAKAHAQAEALVDEIDRLGDRLAACL